MGDRDVTVQTVPCTLLHGIRANEVMVSGHLVSALFRSVLNMRYRRIAPSPKATHEAMADLGISEAELNEAEDVEIE